MSKLKATGDAVSWAKRHRYQNTGYLHGKLRPLDANTSKRFAAEFERAVRQRGEHAKKEASR
jgi:hypothetical protein